MATNKDIERALMEALGMGQRPRMRPKGMGESGSDKAFRILSESGFVSDADKLKMKKMMGDMESPRSPRSEGSEESLPVQKPRSGEFGKTLSDKDIQFLEQMMKRQQMEQGAAERKAFPPPSMMNRGGKVMGYEGGGAIRKKKKSKMGCVMSGRGGKYKGMK